MAMDRTCRVACTYCIAASINPDAVDSIVVYCNTYRTSHLHYLWSTSICAVISCVNCCNNRMVDVRQPIASNAW